jgi:hypothetical protein
MEQQVRLAAKLYEARDASRRILGEKYKERMALYGRGIRVLQIGETQDSVLSATIELAKKCDHEMEVIFVIAAGVELIEPSV